MSSTDPAAPLPKKRQISPPVADLSESAKKAKIATASASNAKPVAVTDEFETEAKTSVPGSVGLGGGEAEGLILSHQVSVFFVLRGWFVRSQPGEGRKTKSVRE